MVGDRIFRPEKSIRKERKLIKKLLTFGGYEVCMEYIEDDVDKYFFEVNYGMETKPE
jgi:hypothetical protein